MIDPAHISYQIRLWDLALRICYLVTPKAQRGDSTCSFGETQRGQLATMGDAPRSSPAADDEWLDFIE